MTEVCLPKRDSAGLHGARGCTPRSEAGGGPATRPEGCELLAAVALHGPHWAVNHTVMP